MKCIVYNVEDPEMKEFYLGLNGVNVVGKCGVEVDLKPEHIEILENAVIEGEIRNPETNKVEMIKKPRYKVVKLKEEPDKKTK